MSAFIDDCRANSTLSRRAYATSANKVLFAGETNYRNGPENDHSRVEFDYNGPVVGYG